MMNTNDAMLCACATTSGGAAWTPANLSNQVGWWNASDIAGKSDGDSVTAWPDSYGLLSDATGTGTYKTGANGIGGQPAVEFNGTSDGFLTGDTTAFGDFFVCCVATVKSTIQSNARLVMKRDDQMSIRRNSVQTNLRGRVLSFDTGAVPYTLDDPSYVFFGRATDLATFEMNTTVESVVSSSTALSTGEFAIGYNNQFNSQRFGGLISMVILLSAYPSTDDLSNLRTYITDTYGIATS